MIKCLVEMFGIPPEVTDLSKIEIELSEGSGLKELVESLRSKIPALAGKVIDARENRILDNYTFIINGRYFPSENELELRDGDRVVLVLMAMGG
jgi:molybdopterin converting factor small subunit